MKYTATKNGVTKIIQRESVKFYESQGWEIRKTSGGKTSPFEYDEVKKNRIEPVVINGQSFSDYTSAICINTKTYVEEPSRTNDGSIPNINDYATFIVPRLKVTFQTMTITDYRRLLGAITPNEFPVTYYDYELDKTVTYNMYCEPREMINIYNKGYELLGVRDLTVSLIGTLNDVTKITMTYVEVAYDKVGRTMYYTDYTYGTYFNLPPKDSSNISHKKASDDYLNYYLIGWNTNKEGTGITYLPNQILQATESMSLYAMWATENPKYNITYALMDGGVNSSSNPTEFTLPITNPIILQNATKSGKTFKGWFKGTSTGIFIKNYSCDYSTQITQIDNNITGNIILCPKWE